MNDLEKVVAYGKMDPIDAMNRLQNAGVVSDNAVLLADVAPADCRRAVDFLLDEVLKF